MNIKSKIIILGQSGYLPKTPTSFNRNVAESLNKNLSTNKAHAFTLFVIGIIALQQANNAGYSIPVSIVNGFNSRVALLFGYSSKFLYRAVILSLDVCIYLRMKKGALVIRVMAKMASLVADIFRNLSGHNFSNEEIRKDSNSLLNYMHCVVAGVGMCLILGKPHENAVKIGLPFFTIIPTLCKIEKMHSKAAPLEDSYVSIGEISLRFQAKMANLVCSTFVMLGHPSKSVKIINAVAIPIMIMDLATDIVDSLKIS